MRAEPSFGEFKAAPIRGADLNSISDARISEADSESNDSESNDSESNDSESNETNLDSNSSTGSACNSLRVLLHHSVNALESPEYEITLGIVPQEAEEVTELVISDEEKSVPEYEICGICLDKNMEPFTTSCNHSFCIPCLYRVQEFNCDFSCPLCRSKITNNEDLIKLFKKNKYDKEMLEYSSTLPHFNPENYPAEVDFSFIGDEMFRRMLLSAYNVITREEKWKYLHDYNPPSTEGFLWSQNIDLCLLMGIIDKEYNGHSGGSLAFTMRRMQFISVYGYNEFKNEWVR